MPDPKTDLLPIRDWKLATWNLASIQNVLQNGTEDQINYILDWSYSGTSAATSEMFYAMAGRPYPYGINHAVPFPVSC